jgi:glutaredoxin
MSSNDSAAATPAVQLFGADWCGDCRRSKRLLDRLGVGYEWIDVSRDEEAQREAAALAGRRNIPVITLPGGQVLVEPSDIELRSALVGTGLLHN